jgi:UDP-glucose 4-epimerase
MNYQNKKVALTGVTGFIGGQLYKRLNEAGAYVNVLGGDVRDRRTFDEIDYEYDYIFHFAAPSSEVLFKRQASYAAETTIGGFLNAARASKRSGAKLIYPSTGLLSMANGLEDKNKEGLVSTIQALDGNHYARTKKICEDVHLGENLDAIGIRLFAAYGPQESHKRDYASVPFLFARDMQQGRGPVIWGDGEQRRDLIYIDDAVEGILELADQASEPIIDLGSGSPVSFNQVLAELKNAFDLHSGANVPDPQYTNRPAAYVDETAADPTTMKKYFTPEFDLQRGMDKLVKGIIDAAHQIHSNDDNKPTN